MRRKLFKSLLVAAFLFISMSVIFAGHAMASAPADLEVSASYKPYGGTSYGIDIPVVVDVVNKTTSNGIAIPIDQGPYNNFCDNNQWGGTHLSPDPPGSCFGSTYPTTNGMMFRTDQENTGNIFGGTRNRRVYDQLIWCGNSVGVPDGEFEVRVAVFGQSENNYNNVPGKWTVMWYFGLPNPIYNFLPNPSSGSSTSAVNVPALNGYRTLVHFEYVEDAPTYDVGGTKFDRWGNSSGPWSGANVSESPDGRSSITNGYAFNDLDGTKNHTISSGSINSWDPTGYRMSSDRGSNWAYGNGASYTFSSIARDANIWLDWYYEPVQSNISGGVRVRNDGSGGSGYNACNPGPYNGLCGQTSMSVNASSPPNFAAQGFVKTYNTSVGPSSPGASSVNFGGLYLGWHRVSANVPAGYRVAGWVVNGGFNSNWTQSYYDIDNSTAAQNTTVEVVLEPVSVTLRGSKRGPGTFINQNSATTDVVNGTVTVNGAQVSGNGSEQTSYSTILRYNPGSGNNGINVTADTGWQIRGYSFCTGTPTAPNCHNDAVQAPNNATSGSIILVNNGDGGDTLNLNIDYSTPTPTINGVALGSDVWLNVYLKPKPIDVQVKAWINQQGGSNQKINPCDQSDYKKQICDDSRIRAVRMNTAGGINNDDNPGRDTGDPAGGAMNVSCTSTDYIPTKPGYNYTNIGNYYCALKDTGGTTGASGTGFISYGQTLDVATGAPPSGNTNPNENNAAIFRNVYPGKYSFQADGTPHNGGTAGWSGSGCPTGGISCNNSPLVSTVANGTSGFPELAYDVGQSTCNINTTNCQDDKTVIADSGGCKLDHRRKASHAYLSWGVWYEDISLNGAQVPWWWSGARDKYGETKCTIMNGGSVADSYYASPEPWNPSFNWNAVQPSRCTDDYVNNWAPGIGSLGTGKSNGTPCGYYKWATKSVYTYSMGIVPLTSNGANTFREQNFIYTPKLKITQGTITCDTYTAKLAFMPDPTRQAESYFRIDNSNLVGSDNQPIIVSTPGGNGADAHDVILRIPKYNGGATSSNTTPTLLKDGLTRSFEHFARFGASDPALVNGYPNQGQSNDPALWSTGGYKYTPTRVFTGNHNCKNIAICDDADFDNQLSQYSVINADNPDPITLNVRMTNTGESYWMRGVNENTYNNAGSRATNHQLIISGGTLSAASADDTQTWIIGNEELRLPDGSHVYPISPKDDDGDPITVDGVTIKDTVEFEIIPTPPKDGGTKFTIGFRMAQDPDGNGWQQPAAFDPNLGSVACESNLEIKVSYKPWLRVQNGNVTALGKIEDQSEKSRGVYKSETSSNTPYKGSVEMNRTTPPSDNAKPALNLHTQFSVAAEEGGENFCSTNFYMLGIANPPDSFDQNEPQQNRNCDFGSMELNIELTDDTDHDGRKELKNDDIYSDVERHFGNANQAESYGQCVDTNDGAIEESLSGPYELSQAFKYYRSWWPIGSQPNTQNLVWANPDGPTLFDGNTDGDGPFGRVGGGPNAPFNLVNTASPNGRPCPTVFQLTTNAAAGSNPNLPEQHRPLGNFSVASGRSTILSDETIYITGNIITSLSGSYQFKRGDTDHAPDTAGLNSLPNLGIIANGDIVVASDVTEIDASLYATGRIITCDKYNFEPSMSGMNEDASKTDKAGTTGSKWIRRNSANPSLNASSPLENRTADPNDIDVAEAPNADNESAKACSNSLKITGSVTAGTSFKFGRNYIDFLGMVQKWSSDVSGAFGNQSPLEMGKFCNRSTVVGAARNCGNILGKRRDFDSPESANPQGYLLEYKAGHPQNYYTGGPAEDFIGNGLASFIPPPGFENLNGTLQSAKYTNNSVKPQF